MSEKFKNTYRIKSARLQNWYYSLSGMYFITICTINRSHFFGEIENSRMKLNELGQCIEQQGLKTFEIRQDMNLQMGEYVIMPNHFHAIIIIGDNIYNTQRDSVTEFRDAMHCVSTPTPTVPPTAADTPNVVNKFGPQTKDLASIIRGFKSSVTTMARKNGNTHFGWQSLFHDHMIRNEKSFQNISAYIINKPLKWKEDKFFKN
ncbi:hypothetical protein K8354_00290 [Polaribacter litorisediminis]|uniref:transposase n=1 Tax=Polaribacter litorisediminis TaxID=1908341 RepID=UPI001CBDF3DC|nr:transposase [Polaribacter litorisediminis]UAM98304.1 hypothetical protein K8354_00290 [Polaribacter litorisediminis]